MIYIILFYAYLFSLCFYKTKIQQICVVIFCILVLIKLVFNYRKCTFSYLECKIRKINKEQGFIFNALDEIYNLNKYKYIYLIYFYITFILLLNLKKYIYN